MTPEQIRKLEADSDDLIDRTVKQLVEFRVQLARCHQALCSWTLRLAQILEGGSGVHPRGPWVFPVPGVEQQGEALFDVPAEEWC